jgi:hypothetical protein
MLNKPMLKLEQSVAVWDEPFLDLHVVLLNSLQTATGEEYLGPGHACPRHVVANLYLSRRRVSETHIMS